MKKRIVIIIGCLVLCIASLGGCRYGEVGREGGAYDYVVKDADVFALDFGNSLNCYVNEVRDVFGDKNLASYFEPEGGVFYMLTTRECKSEYKVVYTDQRTFFSYRCGNITRQAFDAARGEGHFLGLLWGGFPGADAPSVGTEKTEYERCKISPLAASKG